VGREIKFRAWDKVNGKMRYPNMVARYGEEYTCWWIGGESEDSGHCDTKELMQYTGLKDKNGKEVYEGDIVKQTYHAETGNYDDRMTYDGYHIGEVVITASKGVCMKNPLCYAEETDETTRSNQYKSVASYRCEKLGNIYENPELLEVPHVAAE